MASNIYTKSLIWLVSLGGIGYGLMLLTEPSAEKLAEIRASKATGQLTETERKKALFLQRLKDASGSGTETSAAPGNSSKKI